jgi:hypothetical protein
LVTKELMMFLTVNLNLIIQNTQKKVHENQDSLK